ncbi:MAG: sigma factor, partial [Pseudomonadota bacterium]
MAQSIDGADVSDETLIARIASSRDKAAFTLLYQRYAGRIKGMVIKGGASASEADETAQEAMLAVWRRAEQYDPAKAGAPTWIFTIARNRRIDMIRRAKRPEPDENDPLFVP